jgi:hypothetical protein
MDHEAKEMPNPADVAAEIIKRRAAESGLEIAEDFDERIAEARDYLAEEVDTFEAIVRVWPPVYIFSDGVYDPAETHGHDSEFPSEIDVE